MVRVNRTSIFCLLLAASVFSALAQTPPATAPSTTNGASGPFAIGPLNIGGTVDAYYSLNFNHPASRVNQLRNFDIDANQFGLNMAKLNLEIAPDPVGFRVDLGFGKMFDVFNATEPGGDFLRYTTQAYMSVKPAAWKGAQLDVGKFYTHAGAELTETYLNWNYSRALLYANAPYYHFGARLTAPVTKNFTAGVHLVNGWNNVQDNNTGKTVGFTGAFTSSKFSWSNCYYVGPETTDENGSMRHFYDTVVSITPNSKTAFYVNFDYGRDRPGKGLASSQFLGIGGAGRVALTDTFALAGRIEWYNDKDGFITGTTQELKEFTLTGEYKIADGFLWRLEYRRDWSDQPFFERGAGGTSKSMNTALMGFVMYFPAKK